MKTITSIIVCLFLSFAIHAQVPSPLFYHTYYRHVLINYENQLIPYTDIISEFSFDNGYKRGFHSCNKDSTGIFINNNFYKNYCSVLSGVDTINTINWNSEKLPHQIDSTLFYKKMMYSWLIYKLDEKQLNEDTLKKMRLLIPTSGWTNESWKLTKVIFCKDSANIITKTISHTSGPRLITLSDSLNGIQYKIRSGRLNHRRTKKLNDDINLLCEFEVCECIKDEYYPPLLQYFDGKKEHNYLIPIGCKSEKRFLKLFSDLFKYLRFKDG